MNTLIEQLQQLLADGYTHLWNDTDAGLQDSIERRNECKSYEQAEEELANESGYENIELFREHATNPYSNTACHTWIWDIKETLTDLLAETH